MFDKGTLEAAKDELMNNQRIMTDGGDLPDYLTEDDHDFESFRSRVRYFVPGEIKKDVPCEELPRRDAYDGKMMSFAKTEMTFNEDLEASIINVEAWLHGHWLETIEIPEEIEMREGSFFPDLNKATIEMDLVLEEVIRASRQRAKEDSTHFLYILGNWTYLASNNDHVSDRVARDFHRAFERGRQNCINPPGDATTEEFRGGAE
jgi:hypothetical protein